MKPRITYTSAGASFDVTGRHRFVLWRVWDEARPRLLWVMLNPSRAGGWLREAVADDDATIRRCTGFAASWGYGGYDVVNLSSRIATDPKVLLAERYWGAGLGAATISALYQKPALVVLAWGAHVAKAPWLQARAAEVVGLTESLKLNVAVLGYTQGGHPKHPLRLAAALQPVPHRQP